MSEPSKPFRDSPSWQTPRSVHLVALVGTVLTWPLLLVGGSVTVYRVGMSVPDWPSTFGVNMFLYDFLNSSWGVFLEHSHRLYGAGVGFACIVLAVWFAVARTPVWLKALGVFALLAVIGQGVLGGIRVLHNSTLLAFVHGSTAQAFFGLMVVLCVLTGRSWSSSQPRVVDPGAVRIRASFQLALISLQIVLGAGVRHFGLLPLLFVHTAIGVMIAGDTTALAAKVWSRGTNLGPLRPAATALAACALIQVVLGLSAWIVLSPFNGLPRPVLPAQAVLRLAHQGVGALVLAAAIVLTMRALQHLSGKKAALGEEVA